MPNLVTSLASADRAAVTRGGLPVFLELALRHKHGARYVRGEHLNRMAEAFERLYYGETDMLLNNLPSGVGKSEVSSICGPAWIWTEEPKYKFMMASYDAILVDKLARGHRELCESRWYRDRWGDILVGGQAVSQFWTTSDGYRLSFSIQAGGGIGSHCNWYGIDDPLKADDSEKDPALLRTIQSWFGTRVLSRGAVGGDMKVDITMQRLHVADLSGFVAEQFADDPKFEHLMLPLYFEPDRACASDWRTTKGEILWPEDAKRLERTAQRYARMHGGLNGNHFRAMYQQDPLGGADKIFLENTFKDFQGAPPFSETFGIISVDPTFTGGPRSDLMSVEVWGYKDGHFYMYYGEAVQRGFADALAAIIRIRQMYPALHVVIEASANGHAIAETLDALIPGVVKEPADKSKKWRAQAAAHYFTAGHVHFDKAAPWYAEKARDLIRFPAGEHDDRVDTTSQAVLWLARNYGANATMSEAMQILSGEHHALIQKATEGDLRAVEEELFLAPVRELRMGRDVIPSIADALKARMANPQTRPLSQGWAAKAAKLFAKAA